MTEEKGSSQGIEASSEDQRPAGRCRRPLVAERDDGAWGGLWNVHAPDLDGMAVYAARDCTEEDAKLFAAAYELREALSTFLEEYVELVNSGDAGFWDPEKEPKVIAARAALAKADGRQ